MEAQLKSKVGNKFAPEKLSFLILAITAFLVPMFFLPTSILSFQFSKSLLVFLGISLAFIVFLLSVLKSGKFELPTGWVFGGAGLVVFTTFLSAVFSGTVKMSLIGYGFEIGTFSFILAMFLFMFLVSTLYRTKERIFYAYLLFFVSFLVIAFYHLARLLLGPGFLSFGAFNTNIANAVGRWNDLAIFFGLAVVLSLVTFETLSLSKLFRWLLYVILTVSLIFLAVVNFFTVWFVVGVFALTFFVYVFSFNSAEGLRDSQTNSNILKNISPRLATKRISYHSLIVLLVSAIFLIANAQIGNFLATKLGISNLEVRPTMQSNYDIAKGTFKSHLLFGAGPNRFTNEWLIQKPVAVNQTVFWDTDFNYGYGLIPTFVVTTGLLGSISWTIFLALFVFVGFKLIFANGQDVFYRYLGISSFLVSLFLWIMAVLYVPSISIVTLTFFFTGLFFASAYAQGVLKTRSLSFFANPRLSFVAVLVLILVLIATLAFGYLIFQKSLSSYYFQKSVGVVNTSGDIENASKLMLRALSLSQDDLYWRALTQINLLQLNQLLAKQNQSTEAVSDSVKQEFQRLIADTLFSADSAISRDNTNYQNYLSRAGVYASIVQLEGAYDKAKEAYDLALKYNPKGPAIYLALAQLEFSKGDYKNARENIIKALQLKNNYTDAYFLLAQIEIQDKNVKGAIQSVQAATLVDPTNPAIFFQLGVLQYSQGSYKDAVDSLLGAINLLPNYANAKYYLGLSYDKLGKTKEALALFKDLLVSNPNNPDLVQIVKNLEAGKSATYVAPVNTKKTTDKKGSTPVKEPTVKESQP